MNIPGAQSSSPAEEIEPGMYVHVAGGWTEVATACSDDAGRVLITLGPFVYDAEEMVPTCAPLTIRPVQAKQA